MYSSGCLILLLGVLASFCGVTNTQDPNYFFTDQQARFLQNYPTQNDFGNQQEDVSSFRQPSQGFRPVDQFYQPDLQTSDLPVHLQQTLPQYRFSGLSLTTNEPSGFKVSNYQPPFKQDTKFVPSTHRPNYSHLFAKNHDPSRTETFLGQVTLDSPAELPPEFNNRFKPVLDFGANKQRTPPPPASDWSANKPRYLDSQDNINQNLDYTEQPKNTVSLGKPTRSSFLNHRTRIFAPDTEKNYKRPLVKDYFVNSNGDVLITTKIPFSPKPTSTTPVPPPVIRKNQFKPSQKPNNKPSSFNVKPSAIPFIPKSTTEKVSNLESLLEEPINSRESFKHGTQDVEVIQSVTVPPDQFFTLPQVEQEEELTSEDYSTDYDSTTIANNEEHTTVKSEHTTVKPASEATSNQSVGKPESNENKAEDTTDDYATYYEYEDESEEEPEEVAKPHKEPELTTLPLTTVTPILEEETTTTAEDITTLMEDITTFKEDITTGLSEHPESTELTEEEDAAVPDAHEEISEEVTDAHEADTEEYEDDGGQEVTDSNEISQKEASKELKEETNEHQSNGTYEVLTMKPGVMVKEHNFKEFVDSASIDTTDPSVLTTNSQEESKLNESKEQVSISVVTTKSVVNNTVIGTVTPLPMTTQKMTVQSENSTDSWIVIASVQTSRSVSGARYLPSGIVEQQERKAFIGGKDRALLEPSDEADATTVAPTKSKTSTESLIDKLDRVQSDLSSKYLPSQFKNDDNNYIFTNGRDDMLVVETTTPSTTSTTAKTDNLPAVKIRKFSPNYRPTTTQKPKRTFQPKYQKTTESLLDLPQGDQPLPENGNTGRSSGLPSKSKVTVQDVSSLLPPGYKPPKQESQDSSKLLEELLSKAKLQDPSALLPPDYKEKIAQDNVSSLLPSGYKPQSPTTTVKDDIISSLLPVGYTPPSQPVTTTKKPAKLDQLLKNAEPVDISKFLPKDFKPQEPKQEAKNKTKMATLFEESPQDDISKFLPPGFKPGSTARPRVMNSPESSQNKSKNLSSLFEEAPSDDLSKFLPSGYKVPYSQKARTSTTTTTQKPETTPQTTESAPTASSVPSSTSGGGFKLVFPSRPGQNRKATRLTTPRPVNVEAPAPTVPSIQKGWPSRATTEFTGWPTPSTTPISIEKLLAAAKDMASSSTTESTSTTTSTTTTTTTTTTTMRPTTPGICDEECELGGTIKLVGGAKWVPELLDRNTEEWQVLANEVQSQLERVYNKSPILNKWYRKIRIDGFSEGSVLVDYVVMLNDIGRRVNTQEIKRMFHDSLDEALRPSNREPKSTDLNDPENKIEQKLTLGDFEVDPKYTDFVVLPPILPTVGYAEDDVLLPQWAIAVIVIGLASLLFVIIFGVTVLVNRQKNNKKKAPVPLTEDMLNELNKNHMSGVDNYGADDLYNMEDVWNDRPYDVKPKKRSTGSIHDNSMSNLYDSWRSEWNGYYYNAYYANNPGSSRRRSDYDTNF